MIDTDALLAPGRALESLVRRAARGQRAAWTRLLEHTPRVVDAENRWLYPALMHRRPGGANRVALLPFSGEHEQIVELLDYLRRSPAGSLDPMFRAAQWLVLRHVRAERRWLERALAAHPDRDDRAFARFAAHCRPLLDDVAALGGAVDGPPDAAAGAAGPPEGAGVRRATARLA